MQSFNTAIMPRPLPLFERKPVTLLTPALTIRSICIDGDIRPRCSDTALQLGGCSRPVSCCEVAAVDRSEARWPGAAIRLQQTTGLLTKTIIAMNFDFKTNWWHAMQLDKVRKVHNMLAIGIFFVCPTISRGG